MPFNPPFPRPFAASEIRAHVPASPGVFGVSNATEWIYIGETANLQAALLSLLQRPNGGRRERGLPTGFVFELCDAANRPERLQCLVNEYRPSGNQ